MKTMFCWRCQMDMPMLDEGEYQVISKLYSEGIRATKEFRQKHDLPLENCSREERFRPLLQKYRELTDFEETNHIAVLHHRISIYGSPCKICSKPLRTSKATFCAACGENAA